MHNCRVLLQYVNGLEHLVMNKLFSNICMIFNGEHFMHALKKKFIIVFLYFFILALLKDLSNRVQHYTESLHNRRLFAYYR